MEKEIPLDLLIDMMKCAEEEGTLEVTEEEDMMRAKGWFRI